MTRPGRRNRT